MESENAEVGVRSSDQLMIDKHACEEVRHDDAVVSQIDAQEIHLRNSSVESDDEATSRQSRRAGKQTLVVGKRDLEDGNGMTALAKIAGVHLNRRCDVNVHEDGVDVGKTAVEQTNKANTYHG